MEIKIDQTDLQKFLTEYIDSALVKQYERIKELFPEQQERYYTVKEVAQLLDYNPNTIYQFISHSILKTTKVQGRQKISQDQLNEFLKTDRYIITPKRVYKKKEPLIKISIKRKNKFKDGRLIENTNL